MIQNDIFFNFEQIDKIIFLTLLVKLLKILSSCFLVFSKKFTFLMNFGIFDEIF